MNEMTTHEQTAHRYMDGFRRSDHEAILDCLTDDVVWHIHGFRTTRGKPEFDGEIENPAFEGSPELAVERTVDAGDVATAVNEHQRPAGTEVAQVEEGETTDADEAAGRVLVNLAVLQRGNVRKEVDDVLLARLEDCLVGDLNHGRRCVFRRTGDTRAGNDDGFRRDFFRRLYRRDRLRRWRWCLLRSCRPHHKRECAERSSAK